MRAVSFLFVALLTAMLPARADVHVHVGPTPIAGGDATGRRDITVANDRLAFALAVDSPVPYGVPRGALVDIAAVADGKPGSDRAVFADFIPNNWSAWPSTFSRVKVLERGPRRAVVEAVRDWGAVTVTTRYTLVDGSDRVELATTMANGGKALDGLLSGYVLWQRGGHLFGVPGAGERGMLPPGAPRRTVAYDEDYAVALHAPYATNVEYGSRDLYLAHSLAAGETRRFTGFLQVNGSGDLAPVIEAEIAAEAGRDQGTVRGSAPDGAVIVAERVGLPYGWTIARAGRYALPLPAGEYALYATARDHADSAVRAVSIPVRGTVSQSFDALAGPGTVALRVTDGAGPLDARIAVEGGRKHAVGWLGRKTYFTEFDARGRAELPLAPGSYTLRVSHGGGFTHAQRDVALEVATGGRIEREVQLPRFADPAARGWYVADLHHHADQAEAVTPPADLARAQLAAGLDLLFVSDHDTMVNLPAVVALAARRGMPALGSMEFSASWGHFNAYPLVPGGTLSIDMATATATQIFGEARRLGASVVQVNHPFIPYGFFASAANGTAPGGYDAGFDVAEINASAPGDDAKVLEKLWADWNAGVPHYLAGGTDVHDVWDGEPGKVRTFVHVDGPPDAQGWAAGLKAGHAYVSAGPLIEPDIMFGTRLRVARGAAVKLGYTLHSAAGIRKVTLIGNGAVADTKLDPGSRAEFSPEAGRAGWYALVVEDAAGRKAYTNPVWIDVAP